MHVTLCLSGGAARGAFHLGVLQALDTLNVTVKALSGSSIGAVIALSYASGVSPKEQLALFKSAAFKRSIRFNYFKKGIFRIDTSAPIVNELLPVTSFEALNIPTYVTTVDLRDGVLHTLNSGDTHVAALASTALVPLFRPVLHQQMLLADGGFLNNFPLQPLQTYQLPIIGSNAMPVTPRQPQGIRDIFKRALFLLSQSAVIDKLQTCNYYITSPKLARYPLFRRNALDELFALGYTCTHKIFSNPAQEGIKYSRRKKPLEQS